VPEESMPVHADAMRLAQVLLNLLNNAAKFTPMGGRIVLKIQRSDDCPPRAQISIRDSGVGIPKEMIATIFDLFTQSERPIDRAQGGLGIGLTLVRRLTEMHGGTVSVSSAGPGQGSTFTITLPLLDDSAMRTSESNGHTTAPTSPTLSRRILVIDDNRDATNSLAMLLRLLGNEVHTAYDGRQALAVASNQRLDLVLLDLGLPGMTGFEVAKRLRTIPGLSTPTLSSRLISMSCGSFLSSHA
jgi:hypothetical protein